MERGGLGFFQEIFTGHLMCVGQRTSTADTAVNKTDGAPVLTEPVVQWGW